MLADAQRRQLERMAESGDARAIRTLSDLGITSSPAPGQAPSLSQPAFEVVAANGSNSSLTFVIPGATLTANHIWFSTIIPRKKMAEITAPLYKQTLHNVLSGLYGLVKDNFRPNVAMTREGEQWKARVIAQLQPLAPQLPPAKTYSVALEFHGRFLTLDGQPVRRDLDNQTKLLMDAVAEGLGFDDSRVFELHQRKIHDPEEPHTVVSIAVCDPLPQHVLFMEQA